MLENRIIPFLFTLFLLFWNVFAISQGLSGFIGWLAAGLLCVLCALEVDDIFHTLKNRFRSRRAA